MSNLHRIPPSSHRRTRWKNDGGWTTEIARSGEDDFRWRISIAEIESDGPFSSFPGIDRDLLLLEGNGIELDIDDAPPRRLVQRFERVQFAGEAKVDCRLVAGPTRDLNLMLKGVPGSMRRVVAAQAWRPDTRECGLYAITAGACEATAPDERAPMPAHALRWWSQAPEALAFAGEGWWLGAGAKEAAP